MQVAPAFVLKDVVHFARIQTDGNRDWSRDQSLSEFSQESRPFKQEWAELMQGVSKKVSALRSPIAIVEKARKNEVQIYRGTVKMASFSLEGSVTALREA